MTSNNDKEFDIKEYINENQLKDCLEKQLNEMNIINSIYCNPGEFHIDDHSIQADINQYLDGKINYFNNKLDYEICLQEDGHKIFIIIELPHLYPILELPDVHIRSTLFNKTQEKLINMKIRKFMKTLIDSKCTYIYEIIIWIQENMDDFKLLEKNVITIDEKNSTIKNDEKLIDLERLWIYSHHIKNKTKRQNIVKNAKELNLTGFSLPGKPGIICVEGYETDTQEFWKLLKLMKWQKITIKKNEFKTKKLNEIENFHRFTNFREVLFTECNNDNDKDKDDDESDVKMNMSLFMKFLEQHNCRYMTKILFGFE